MADPEDPEDPERSERTARTFDELRGSLIASISSLPSEHRLSFSIVNPYNAHKLDDDDAASVGDELPEDILAMPIPDQYGRPFEMPERAASIASSIVCEDSQDSEFVHDPPRSVLHAGRESIKYIYSLALLFFSVIVVMSAMFTEQTTAAENSIHPVGAFFIFWFLILWLAMIEGGQGALVGLQPIDKALYAESHPISHMCAKLAHKGDNMERFIVGRQFLVVLIVFITNMMGSAVADATVLGMSDVMAEIFLATGVAMILTTIMIGQLTAQVNAANCMLDFINNYFMLGSAYVSLAIEFSGLLHCVYLVQIIFSKIIGRPIASNEPQMTGLQNIFFWARVIFSLGVLTFAFAVTLTALFDGKTTMWDGVPEAVSVVIFFVLMCFVGMMEGMQIALFAVINIPDEELSQFKAAHGNCQLAFAGQNLQAFLIGRQICVTICTFVVARITTLDIANGEDTIFGVPMGLQNFFNTGLLGALITTIVASLAWRIIASSFPLAFLSNPLIYYIIRLCLLLEESGVCSASWVLARYQKPLFNYQPDEVYLEGAPKEGAAPVTRRDRDIDRVVVVMKYVYSLALLVFSVIVVMAAMFTEQTTAAEMGVHPAGAFFIFWFLILWLAVIEGGQGALVGLQPIEKDSYADTHSVALKCTSLAHKGDNMQRYIVGRQLLVVLIVFVTNMMGSAVADAAVLGLSDTFNEIFLATGIAMILTTIILGQLTAQVNAANCMLDFINNYFMLFSTHLSLFIEFSGLLHSVYLVQIVFSKLTGQQIHSNESPRTVLQNIFFWARVIFSLCVLSFAFAVTLKALFDGQTTMWDGVPEAVSIIIFFVLMGCVGMLEGMQIALFSVVNMPNEQLKQHKVAYANCQLAFAGQNLQAFLIGRQICVTICMFVVARITTVDIADDEDTIFGVSRGLQKFFNTGLLGAIITTIVASLAWRIIASSFPLGFLSNPLIYIVMRLCLVLELSGVCYSAWVLARYQKPILGFQLDEVYLEGAEKQGSAPVTKRDKDIDVTVTVIKYVYSMGLLIFSVIIVMSAIFTEQTKVSEEIHPLVAFFVFWLLLIWLAMIEGGQGCLVGLQPVDKSLYAMSHPTALKSTTLAHKGDNMQRFIVGRQFLVVLLVFVINMCGSAVADASVLGMSDVMNEIFLASGIAMILTTIMIGQLTAQINAANCMLDFINTYFMLFSAYVSLFIEFSGLLHSVYLVQIIFSKITGKPFESNEPPRTALQNVFFWARVLFSLCVLGFAFAVTLKALFDGNTLMWDSVPEAVSVIIFFVLMCFVGMMEGMQIALFAVLKMPKEELRKHKVANANCELTFSGRNLQAFLIGRQICVTICMFVVARITTLDIAEGEDTIFGVSSGLQNFFNTGLLGALITTIVGSLAWRIIGSSFPLAFLSNPLIYVIIRLCLLLEASGVCSGAWVLALIQKAIIRLKLDEEYIGFSDKKSEQEVAFDDEEIATVSG